MDRPLYRRRFSSSASSPVLQARKPLKSSNSSNSINVNSAIIDGDSSISVPFARPRSRSRSASRSRSHPNRHSSSTTSLTAIAATTSIAAPVSHNAIPISLEDIVYNVSIDNTLPIDYFKQDILAVIKTLRIPKWRRIDKSHYKKISLERISGAMTNCVYKLSYSNYYPLLLRIYGDVENIIDRDSELMTLLRLSKRQIGPKLLGCFKNGRFEEFLNNSITLNKHQIREPKISRMIARRMKEFHNGVDLSFDEYHEGPKSWQLIDKWIKIIDPLLAKSTEEEQKAVFLVTWAQFKDTISKYKQWLYDQYTSQEALNDTLRFCHNDAQYGNLLFYSKSEAMTMSDDEDGLVEDSEITNLSLNHSLSTLTLGKAGTTNSTTDSAASPSDAAAVPIVTDTSFKYDTRLTVIDFEYAGANPPAYDIANHFCEWMYDYHHPERSYATDEHKFPTLEERINLLNSYVKYVPGSTTPHLGPTAATAATGSVPVTAGSVNTTTTTTTTTTSSSGSGSGLSGRSHSVVSLSVAELPHQVIRLYNETVYWRSVSCIFWILWAIINRGGISSLTKTEEGNQSEGDVKFEYGPNGELYKITNSDTPDASTGSDEEFIQPTLDDEFDHLKYALGKAGVLVGDMLQFGILKEDNIEDEKKTDIKYIDTVLLPQQL
jgi:choline kinase